MASAIFLIIDTEVLAILPYISSYFITSEVLFSNTNIRKNDPIHNNDDDNNNNNNNNNNSDDDNNDLLT